MSDGKATLSKQRRNLLLVSAAMIVFNYAELSISKVSINGASIEIGDPNAIRVITWVLWFYFLARYYQYYREVGADNLWEAVRDDKHRYIASHVKKAESLSGVGVIREGNKTYCVRNNRVEETGQYKESFRKEVSSFLLLWWGGVAFLNQAIHTPKFTDGLVPFIVAACAGVAFICY